MTNGPRVWFRLKQSDRIEGSVRVEVVKELDEHKECKEIPYFKEYKHSLIIWINGLWFLFGSVKFLIEYSVQFLILMYLKGNYKQKVKELLKQKTIPNDWMFVIIRDFQILSK